MVHLCGRWIINRSLTVPISSFINKIEFNLYMWERCSNEFYIYSILQSFSYQLIVSYNSNQNGLV